MSVNQNFPEVSPSLLLDFANSRTLDPRITFERSSIGTYVASNGLIKTAAADEPRFDHDPETGESLGLLIEESRTNKFSYSEQFVNAGWDKSNIIITYDQIISPDGSLNADKFRKDSSNTEACFMTDDTSLTNGVTYTQSIWAKAGEKTHLQIAPSTGFDSRYQNFNLVTGTLGNGDVQSASIEAYGNGWYRCSVTQTANNSISGRMAFALAESNSSSRISTVSGNEGDGIYIWGAQLEEGSFTTSYIPTSGSQVTRQPDNASITGTNFSSWFNPIEGTLYSKYFAGTYSSEVPFALSLSSDEQNNIISISSSSAGPIPGAIATFFISDNGVSQTGLTHSTNYVDGDVVTSAAAYKLNDSGFAVDGSIYTDNSTTIPNLDIVRIGKYPYFGIWNNKPIAQIMYYPKRLSNEQLQNLTK